MTAPHSTRNQLKHLIGRIEALFAEGPSPGCLRLAEALQGPLDPEAFAPWVRFAEDRYTRNLITSAAGWELRLLCWAPGQTSTLHGHGVSGCAFRVLAGSAEEIRLGGERRALPVGTVAIAGADEVHQVGNVGDAPLVTLHLYAPALPVDQPSGADGHRVVVLGGGFCGAALALRLLERGGPDLRITVVQRSGRLGRGVAYGTEDPAHLLNVPASKMSLYPEDPESFLRFARARGLPADPTSLLPRALYGDYLEATLAEAVRRAPGRLRVAAAEAVDLTGNEVWLSDGRILSADAVVLATGHLPPRWPVGLPEALRGDPRVLRDAWDPGALDAQGAPDPRLWVLGAARRPRLWETTAVPELSRQADALADALLRADAARGQAGLRTDAARRAG